MEQVFYKSQPLSFFIIETVKVGSKLAFFVYKRTRTRTHTNTDTDTHTHARTYARTHPHTHPLLTDQLKKVLNTSSLSRDGNMKH